MEAAAKNAKSGKRWRGLPLRYEFSVSCEIGFACFHSHSFLALPVSSSVKALAEEKATLEVLAEFMEEAQAEEVGHLAPLSGLPWTPILLVTHLRFLKVSSFRKSF